MSSFDDMLWSELVQAHSTLPRAALGRAEGRRRRSPGRLVAVGAIALVGATMAVLLSMSAQPSAPAAFAITQQPDGSVTLTLSEIMGVGSANQELADRGIPVRIAKVEAGCTATGEIVPPRSYSHERLGEMVEIQRDDGVGLSGLTWTIHPSAIPPGDTLLITAEVVSGSRVPAVASRIGLYHGQAPTCQPPGDNYVG